MSPTDICCYRDEHDQRTITCDGVMMKEAGNNLKLYFALEDAKCIIASHFCRCGVYDDYNITIDCDECDFSIDYFQAAIEMGIFTESDHNDRTDIIICPTHQTTMSYGSVRNIYRARGDEIWVEKQNKELLSCNDCDFKTTMKEACHQTLNRNNPMCEHLRHWQEFSFLI